MKLTWQWLDLINPVDPQDGKAGLLSIQSVHKLSKKRLYYPVKRSGKWLLSWALSQTKVTNFYDITSQRQSPITAGKKKKKGRKKDQCIHVFKKKKILLICGHVQPFSFPEHKRQRSRMPGICRSCDLCDWHVKHYLGEDKCLATGQ